MINEENKEFIENKELDSIDNIPAPEDIPAPEPSDTMDNIIDPDFIPAPEEDNEYLPEITPEMVREEMLGVDENGHCRCVIVAELKKIEKFNPEIMEESEDDSSNAADDEEDEEIENSVPIADCEVENCRVREYTLDGNIVNLELIFDNPLDKGMQEVHQMLEEYKEMCEAFDKAELGEGDLPVFTVYFMPSKYPGRAIAAYSQPFAYFKTMGYGQDDERILHMMFPIERTDIKCYRVKKEELEAMEEYVVSRINEGGNI